MSSTLNSLKNNKAPGYEKILNEYIKLGGKTLVRELTKLFNNILKNQKVPLEWKHSDMILIFKTGNRHLIKNYRPISLSPAIAKKIFKINRIKNPKYFDPHNNLGNRLASANSTLLWTIYKLQTN